ncbi:MAG: hypothetical protein M1822_009077 [Bathelium mastoideum]|nr:MAG: hypothetical protein M1822_009077 [Bathelium mastoideum]
MALQAFPKISQSARLDDGTSYAFVHVPTVDARKPTFLLLHGFPSSSWDWRHQISQLSEAGYGILAPDLLGYGDTDKPKELQAYSMKKMSGVAHFWPVLPRTILSFSSPLSLYPCLTLSPVLFTTSVPTHFLTPTVKSHWLTNSDAFNALTQQAFGYPTFGYQKWFNTEGAAKAFDRNPQAAFSLIYPTDPEIWKTNFCPVGSAEAWIANDKITPLPSWVTMEENATRNEIMRQGGYAAPLRWYKSAMQGINNADEANFTDEEKLLTLPNLLIVSTQDYATRADMQEQSHRKWAKKPKVEVLECGHWIQMEKREELYQLLVSFAHGLAGVEK